MAEELLATEFAKYFKLDSQGENESDSEFKNRVATYLRANGRIIEGAIATYRDLGREYSDNPENYIGDDIAAGHAINHENPFNGMNLNMVMMALALKQK
jgi:hypothetical protein